MSQPPPRLGQYEIGGRLGSGGMGEVYRARDTRLNRDVAIKVLPAAVAQDPERLARFRREAQLLAALNHPHIAAIYGLEAAEGIDFLVLELVEGETLADRLRAGALPVSEAIAITRQICDALASAHERGVIHRDLKPANIALTADDRVKVLDFGLARSGGPKADERGLADSPTITAAGVTSDGVILGTAPYMSPEQAAGRMVDKRSDVWSLGCVLFEMLTGQRAFGGETVTETLANVIKGEPDWGALPAGLSPAIVEILRGTLQKDRKTRIADLSTVSFVLDRPVAPTAAAPPRPAGRLARLGWLAAGLALGAALAAAILLRRPLESSPAVVARFSYELADDTRPLQTRRAVAVSPDGKRLAVVTVRGLWLRELASDEGRLVPNTQGALVPVFGPDGESLVFWSDGMLKRLTIGVTSTVTLATVGGTPNYLSWTGDTLLYTQGRSTIMRVSASGGTPETVVDLKDEDLLPSSVQLLPDGDMVLYTAVTRSRPRMGIDQRESDSLELRSLRSGKRTRLATNVSDAQYVRSGHVLYLQAGTVYAASLDPRTGRMGTAVPVVEGVGRATAFGGVDTGRAAQLAVSESGTLAYLRGPETGGRQDLVLFDETGKAEPLNLPPGSMAYPRVSPDGSRLAFEARTNTEIAIMIHDRANPRSMRRLTFGGNNRYPVWTPDGRQVTFQSDREGDAGIFRQSLAGGPAERLTRAESGSIHFPESWSPDGRVLLFIDAGETRATLKALTTSDGRVEVFGDVRDSYLLPQAVFSPDGKWVAYQFAAREDQGEAVTYIEPYPRTGTKYEVGPGGRPVWSRDGARLFFVPNPSQWMAVNFRTQPEVSISSPQPVPRWFGVAPPASRRPFDLLPDGRVVAAGVPQATADLLQVHVVLNWFQELQTRVPAKP